MKHLATPDFWDDYHKLPEAVQRLADKNFGVLKEDPGYPSLHFKRVGRFRSARVGIHYRALAVESGEDILWFWIGTHAEYDRIIGS